MVILEFVVPEVDSVLGRSWVKALEGDTQSITEAVLRYKMFYSQVEFSIDGVKFLSKSSFVPLIDLALGISDVVGRLADDSDGALDFTEHDEIIKFVLIGGESVQVASSKNPAATATAEKVELLDALASFVGRARDSVETFCPAISKNATAARLCHAD